MPIYEYGCQTCGHNFERLQKMSDGPPKDCPECGDDREIKKLVSRSSFVLKGGGWYKDHYGLKGSSGGRSSGEGGDAGGSDAGGSDAGGSDAGGSDAGGSDAGGSDAGGSTEGGSTSQSSSASEGGSGSSSTGSKD